MRQKKHTPKENIEKLFDIDLLDYGKGREIFDLYFQSFTGIISVLRG